MALKAMTTSAPQVLAPKKKKKRGTRKKATVSGSTIDGEINISRAELIATIKLDANKSTASGYLQLNPSSFSFLKSVGKAFNRSRWSSLKVYYKPAVGTTWGGLVSMGFMLDSDQSVDVTRTNVVAMTPSCTNAAWMDTEPRPLVLKGSQLRTRDWYFHNDADLKNIDKGPGTLYWALDGTNATAAMTVGEVWLHYSITMQGTESS